MDNVRYKVDFQTSQRLNRVHQRDKNKSKLSQAGPTGWTDAPINNKFPTAWRNLRLHQVHIFFFPQISAFAIFKPFHFLYISYSNLLRSSQTHRLWRPFRCLVLISLRSVGVTPAAVTSIIVSGDERNRNPCGPYADGVRWLWSPSRRFTAARMVCIRIRRRRRDRCVLPTNFITSLFLTLTGSSLSGVTYLLFGFILTLILQINFFLFLLAILRSLSEPIISLFLV